MIIRIFARRMKDGVSPVLVLRVYLLLLHVYLGGAILLRVIVVVRLNSRAPVMGEDGCQPLPCRRACEISIL